MVVLLQQITFQTIIFKLPPNVHLKIKSHSNIYEDPNNWWSIGSKYVIENWPSGPTSSFLWFRLCLSYKNHISRAYQITWIFCVSVCACTGAYAFSLEKHYICKSTFILASHFWSRLKNSKRKWEWNWHKEGRMRRNKLLKNRLMCSKFKYFFHVFVKITETKFKTL